MARASFFEEWAAETKKKAKSLIKQLEKRYVTGESQPFLNFLLKELGDVVNFLDVWVERVKTQGFDEGMCEKYVRTAQFVHSISETLTLLNKRKKRK